MGLIDVCTLIILTAFIFLERN